MDASIPSIKIEDVDKVYQQYIIRSAYYDAIMSCSGNDLSRKKFSIKEKVEYHGDDSNECHSPPY